MSGNGPQTEIYKLAAECRSKVVGLHVGSREDTISTGKLPAASFEFSLRKPVDFIGPNCFHFETLQIFQCRGFTWRMFSQGAQSNLQLPAGCFGCSVSERHQMLTGMRFGTMCCIYGMNGSQTLLQMHTPTVELSSACKPAGGPFRAQAKGNDIYAKYVEHG